MSSPLGPGAEWRHRGPPLLFWAIPLFLIAFVAYWSAHILGALRYLVPMSGPLQRVDELLLWYSGIPAMLALAMALTDLFVLLPVKRRKSVVRNTPPPSPFVTVALTAYNDEQSIGAAVEDFIKHPLVRRVIVIDNNSRTRPQRERAPPVRTSFSKPGRATVGLACAGCPRGFLPRTPE